MRGSFLHVTGDIACTYKNDVPTTLTIPAFHARADGLQAMAVVFAVPAVFCLVVAVLLATQAAWWPMLMASIGVAGLAAMFGVLSLRYLRSLPRTRELPAIQCCCEGIVLWQFPMGPLPIYWDQLKTALVPGVGGLQRLRLTVTGLRDETGYHTDAVRRAFSFNKRFIRRGFVLEISQARLEADVQEVHATLQHYHTDRDAADGLPSWANAAWG